MRFHLSEEQELIQSSIRRTLEDVCDSRRRREIMATGNDLDPKVWRALMDLGLGGLIVPTAFGGSGLGILDAALALETLSYQAAPAPLFGQLLASHAIALGDNTELKAHWLPHLASGEAVATTAFGDGWAPPTWQGHVADQRLTADIRFVPSAQVAKLFVVGIAGGGLVAVEAGDGVEIEDLASSDLARPLATVRFRNAPCAVVGGVPLGERVFDAGLVLLAADALGGAQRCLDLAVEYAKTREQFGVVIAQFQGLKHQLANMALQVEPARALVWYAAYAADVGLNDASRAAALAKAHLADRFVAVARAATEAHGGIGYTWEYDLQLFFRRSLFDRAFMGAPSLHRERSAVMAGW